jgi:hypothetical protein
MHWKNQLPAALQAFTEEIAATNKPCVRLTVEPRAPSSSLDNFLAGFELEEGGGCRFVASLLQLNLARLPAVAGFPTQGVLQFILDENAGGHGAAVKEVDEVPDTLPKEDAEGRPLQYRAISGQYDEMPMLPEDYRFPTIFEAMLNALGQDRWLVLADYRRIIGASGHRLGGYGAFIQDDPRSEGSEQELFLQLDADPGNGLYWGDLGRVHWLMDDSQTFLAGIIDSLSFNLEMS